MYLCKKLTAIVLFSLFPLIPAPQQSLATEEKLIRFGRVQDNPVRAIRDRQEFVDYIAKKLAPVGITGGRIVVVDKVGQLSRAVKERKVDFFHDSVAATIVMSKWSGSIPILRQWKYKEAEYNSVILVNKHSGIDSLSHLNGKIVAFDEPHSTSAHILPRMLLTENKLKLVPVVLPGTVESDAVGYIHSSDDNAPNLLLSGKVDAAATSFREFQTLRPEIQSGLKILATSMSVPRQIISVRKDLDPKVLRVLTEILIDMEKSPEGQAVLKRQQGTTNIDTIPSESLERMKDLEKFIFSDKFRKQVDSW